MRGDQAHGGRKGLDKLGYRGDEGELRLSEKKSEKGSNRTQNWK